MWSFINDYCHKKCIVLCLKLWWPLLAKLLISGSVSKVILKERKISDLTVYNMISFVNIPQKTADLVTFTEEILNGKLYFFM